LDPSGFSAHDPDLYRFENDRPIQLLDPTGLEPPDPGYINFWLDYWTRPTLPAIDSLQSFTIVGVGQASFRLGGFDTNELDIFKTDIVDVLTDAKKAYDEVSAYVDYLGNRNKVEAKICKWFIIQNNPTQVFIHDTAKKALRVIMPVYYDLTGKKATTVYNASVAYSKYYSPKGDTYAYASSDGYVALLTPYWNLKPIDREETLYHEFTHLFAGTGDPAYLRWDGSRYSIYDKTKLATTDRALRNADSYGGYVVYDRNDDYALTIV
jgi:hypothetical protein